MDERRGKRREGKEAVERERREDDITAKVREEFTSPRFSSVVKHMGMQLGE